MRKFFILPVLGILFGVTSCECNGEQYFGVSVYSQKIPIDTRNSFVIHQPTAVEMTVPSSYSTGCRPPSPYTNVQSVTFFNGDLKIGEVNKAPFSLTWIMTPGQDGIPLTGSAKVQVKAQDSTGRTSFPFEFTVQVDPPIP